MVRAKIGNLTVRHIDTSHCGPLPWATKTNIMRTRLHVTLTRIATSLWGRTLAVNPPRDCWLDPFLAANRGRRHRLRMSAIAPPFLLHLLTAAFGTKLPIRDVRYSVAFGGEADLCRPEPSRRD
jgi:hypothetical protein